MADNQLVKCEGCGKILEADYRLGTHQCPLKVGLVGHGRWGREWARVLYGMGALQWVVDPAVNTWKVKVVASPGDPVWATTLDSVLDRHPVDAVVVATPPATHYEVVHGLLGSGVRGVLVEKPMALDPEHARRMMTWARKADMTLSVGHTFLHTAAWRRALEVLPSYGTSRLFEAGWRQPPAYVPESARQAGVLWDLGPHPLSMLLSVAPPGLPNVVRAEAHCVRSPRDRVRFSLAWVTGGYDFRADVVLSFLGGHRERAVQVSTAEGAVLCWPTLGDLHHGRWDSSDGFHVVDARSGGPGSPTEPLRVQAEAFLQDVVCGAAGNAEDGVRVVEILHMIEEAL